MSSRLERAMRIPGKGLEEMSAAYPARQTGLQTRTLRELKEMFEDILDGLNALGPRLDAIEKDIKEIKEVLGIGKVSAGTNK